MEIFILMLVTLVSIVIFIIYSIVESIQQAREERQIFSGTIDKVRLAFLEGIFELRAGELKQLRFDGFHFHIGEELPYQKFARIEFVKSSRVKIVNQKIPHSSDMMSRRFLLRLQGSEVKSYVTYDLTETYLGKLNEMLAYAEPVCLEYAYARYCAHYESWQSHLAMVRVAKNEKDEVEQVLLASKRLLSQGTTDQTILEKHDQLGAELDQVRARIRLLTDQAKVSEIAATDILNDVRAQIRLARYYRERESVSL